MSRTILKGGDDRVRTLPLHDFMAPAIEERAKQDKAVCETRVEVLRQDGVVTAIEVQCSCGESTRVSLNYVESTSQTSDPA
ncbi:MAG: hypothetical protein ACI8QC_004520 [Planctomycetota bacterium]|jgi:hypothetical protein